MSKPEGIFHCAERGTHWEIGSKTWVATGEYRAPLANEWYIFNGTRFKEARRAHENLTEPQWIAAEV